MNARDKVELKIELVDSEAREFNFANSFIPGADFRRPRHT